MPRRSASFAAAGFCALVVIACGVGAQSPSAGSRNSRDVERLVGELRLRPGSVVGEIGAGDGELALAIAQAVGTTGRVYATELGERRVESLRRAVKETENVTVIAGHENRTNLPEGCCDAVFMRNVYHHFADPAAMNESLWRSLRPDGRLAVLDFTPPPGGDACSPADRDRDGQHGVSADALARELTAAGFEVLTVNTGPEREVFVSARKP